MNPAAGRERFTCAAFACATSPGARASMRRDEQDFSCLAGRSVRGRRDVREVHRPGAAGYGPGSGRGQDAPPQLHRHRAHPARPDPRGRRRRRQGPGVAGDQPGGGPPARRGITGQGQQAPSGHIPFTPRAKKVLELSLREALQLGHNYIGTEHILLGLIREGEGVAAQVLVKLGADPGRIRQQVNQLLRGSQGKEPAAAGRAVRDGALRLACARPVRPQPDRRARARASSIR